MADKKISQLTAASTPLAGTEVLPIVQSGATVKVSVSNLTAGRPVDVSTLTASGLIKSTTANAFLIQNSTATGANYMRLVNGEGTFYLATENSAGTTFGAPAYANILYGNSAYPVIIYTNGTEKLRVASGGDVTVNTGNLVIGTAGKGIDFSATSDVGGMTSELLDDYEEGTWTPTFEGGTTNPTISAYAARVGSYTKIGDLLFISFRIAIDSGNISGGSGDTVIAGLPYAINNATTYTVQYIPVGYNYMDGTAYTAGAGGGPRWQASGSATTKLANYTTGNGIWGTGVYEFTGTGVFKIA